MNQPKSYQLLVLPSLEPIFRSRLGYPVLVAILSWLKESVEREHAADLSRAELEIVKVQFVGDGYPSLAIHYFDKENPRDLGPLVEAAVETLIQKSPVADLVGFLASATTDWAKAASSVMQD
jgi:hypothetical protein